MKLINTEYSEYENVEHSMQLTRRRLLSMGEYLSLLKEKFGIALPLDIKFKPLLSERAIIRFPDEIADVQDAAYSLLSP